MIPRRAVRAVALVLALFLAVVPAFAETESDKLIEKAREYVVKKDFKKAIHEYETVLKTDPKNSKATLLLGLAWAAVGDLDKALQFTEASLELEPSYSGYHNLGLILANRSDYEKAVQAYEKALSLKKDAHRTWYQLGLIHAASGDFGKSTEAYRKAIELHPQFADAYIGLGSALYWSGDKTAAMEQVIRLKAMHAPDQAAALENWLQSRDRKKQEAAATGQAAPADGPAETFKK